MLQYDFIWFLMAFFMKNMHFIFYTHHIKSHSSFDDLLMILLKYFYNMFIAFYIVFIAFFISCSEYISFSCLFNMMMPKRLFLIGPRGPGGAVPTRMRATRRRCHGSDSWTRSWSAPAAPARRLGSESRRALSSIPMGPGPLRGSPPQGIWKHVLDYYELTCNPG